MIYVPRSNSIYEQLEELKDVFLQLSVALDQNYDLVVAARLDDMDRVLISIDSWQDKDRLPIEGRGSPKQWG